MGISGSRSKRWQLLGALAICVCPITFACLAQTTPAATPAPDSAAGFTQLLTAYGVPGTIVAVAMFLLRAIGKFISDQRDAQAAHQSLMQSRDLEHAKQLDELYRALFSEMVGQIKSIAETTKSAAQSARAASEQALNVLRESQKTKTA